jgi:hypothetical protein
MTAPHDPDDSDEDVHAVHRGFLADLSAAAGDAQAVTLAYPRLEYSGQPADEPEFDMTHWFVNVTMGVAGDWDENRLNVGFLELWTLSLDVSPTNALDATSADSAEYLPLLSDDELSDDVAEQFDSLFVTGLLILNRAYVHPALRGRDLGAWAVAQAIRNLTFGSTQVLVVAYPTPTEDRPGVSVAAGAKALAGHWAKVGLEPIEACPRLVGQTTAANALYDARDALADVADLEISVAVSGLIAPGDGKQEGA